MSKIKVINIGELMAKILMKIMDHLRDNDCLTRVQLDTIIHNETQPYDGVGNIDFLTRDKPLKTSKPFQLQTDMKIACEIYKANIENKDITHSDLRKIFKDKMSVEDFEVNIDRLTDIGTVDFTWNKQNTKSHKRCYEISSHSKESMQKLYEDHYGDKQK